MKNYTSIAVLCICLSLFTNLNFVQAQSTIVELSPLDQTVLADMVVEAEIIKSNSFWDPEHKNIYTKHTLKIYKIFKGNVTSTIELIVPGGIVDLEAHRVTHVIKAKKGDIGIYILRNSILSDLNSNAAEESHFMSVGGDQSFYKYDFVNEIAANPYNGYSDYSKTIHKDIMEGSDRTTPLIVELLPVEYESQSNQSQRVTSSSRQVNQFTATEFTGGTESVLTITGSGFGSTMGTIAFSNSDYGGFLKSEVLDTQILNWTDSEIQVEIPEFAGTGYFEVRTSDGSTITSDQEIDIDYAQSNMNYDIGSGDEAFNTQHIAKNGDGGYTFTLNDNFANTGAKEAFTRAFEQWACDSGINWKIDPESTSINDDLDDEVNIVTFDSNNSMAAGTLGTCVSRYQGCFEDGKIKWYVKEMDLVFNDRDDWNFSTSPTIGTQLDLESVAVHELGHAHQLNHVIDTNKVMHYSLAAGEVKREPSVFDLNGAIDVQKRNTANAVCGNLAMTDSSCSRLSVEDYNLENEIAFYPNPVQDKINIENRGQAIIENIKLLSINGQMVVDVSKDNIYNSMIMDVSNISNGIYILSFQTDLGTVNKKLIIE